MRGVTLACLVVLLSGCSTPDAIGRGPPRVVDDGSEPIPSGDCGTIGSPLGWNASFYNVGGSGDVVLTLYVNGLSQNETKLLVAADSPANATLSWSPITWGPYELELRWGPAAGDEAPRRLAEPVTRQYPCGTGCLDVAAPARCESAQRVGV